MVLDAMLGFLAVLTIGGLIILARELREVRRISREVADITRETLREVNRGQ